MVQIVKGLYKTYLKKIRGLSLPRDLIDYAVKINYNKVVVSNEGEKMTYGEIYKNSLKLVNSFLKIGIKKGDKVGVMIYNCKEYFEIKIASYMLGIVLVPIMSDLNTEDIVFILKNSNVKVFVYDSDILRTKIKRIKKETFVEKFVFVTKLKKKDSYDSFLSKGEIKKINVKLNSEDLSMIGFSSGTTGKAKGICFDQKIWVNSFYNYFMSPSKMKMDKLRVLHILPLGAAGGTAFLPFFFLGTENYFLEKFDASEAVSKIVKNDIGIIFVSPSYLMEIIDYCNLESISLNLRRVIVGTEPISKEKFKQAIDFFGPVVVQGYGMAEVLPPLSLLSAEDYIVNGRLQEDKLLSVGRCLKGVKVKILNEKNKEVVFGKLGRIILKSSTISKGYWNNYDLTRNYYRRDWFFSDDFGYLDKEGYIYVYGRKEDILKKNGGEVIFKRPIEEVVHQYPGVLEVYLFCDSSKEIICYVSLKNGFSIKNEELINFCNKRLEKDFLPKKFVIGKIPKRINGKIDRVKIERRYFSK
ncbi:acyl--CoA ligase [archaeon]|jgi:acyl-coenzyme A synthetase/AMP-(fatty) acid ligase|nr:acyl--CoA ligase [archaeon]